MSFRDEFIFLLNKLREDPTFIIPDLKDQMKYVGEDNVLMLPDADCGIELQDGKESYEQAIKVLKTLKPAPPLVSNVGLNAAAKEYLAEIKKVEDPEDVPGEKFDEIIDKHGSFSGAFSNISEYGGETPKQALINLLVQDGSDEKSNAISFTSDKYKEIGFHCATHNTFRFCTLIFLVTKFKINDKIEQDDKEEGEVSGKAGKSVTTTTTEKVSNDGNTKTVEVVETTVTTTTKTIVEDEEPKEKKPAKLRAKKELKFEVMEEREEQREKRYNVNTTIFKRLDGTKEVIIIREPNDEEFE